MSRSVCAVIPAAGRGTRLGLDVPKIMAEIADGVTVWHLLHRALRASVDHVHVVIAPAAETRFHRLAAEEIAGGAVSVSVQREPTGMGDAVFGASGHWESHGGILVVWGDQVNLSGRTVRRVVDAHLRAPGLTIPLVPMPDPYVEYELSGGRLLRVRQSREGDACPGPAGSATSACSAWRRAGSRRPGGTTSPPRPAAR
ncbi:NTP transferase domain-containing protein [Actinomadura madurae]|uniref:NTP transferase domain-containing protein n=1 Tax=Actinomadura madurae TaxID=1993 RepID=UPI0020D24611|nr:NTP transferase domain-containing protein [Actinomadura madurae]MCQ0018069.1 NTP transferase domain-containing protein [Actinomadura madurae]